MIAIALTTLLFVTSGLMPGCASPLPTDVEENREPRPPQTAGVATAPTTDDETPAAAGDKEDDQAGEDDPVITLLETLESSAADLRTFTANVHYVVEDALEGDRVIRKGEIIYRVDPDNDEKAFAILFNSVIEDNRKRDRKSHYVFSGRWFAEIDHEQKLFIKREVVAPGEDFDPLKLGEGPFPLPIGQEKDEVLARFDVAPAELPEEGPLAKLKGTTEVDGLLLIPKKGTSAAEDFERIELFYDRQTHLPVGVAVTETNGDLKIARLDYLKRNVELDGAALKNLDVTEPDPRVWRVEVRRLERE
jgi:hypothetical protein